MSILNKFEKGVEGAVNSVFSKLGSRDLKPVDLSTALKKELDDKTVSVGNNRKVAPNIFTMILSTYDFDNVEKWGAQMLVNELSDQISEHADTEGYSFVGPVQVMFNENVENAVGEYQITSAKEKSEFPDVPEVPEPAASLPVVNSPEVSSKYPTIDVDGNIFELKKPIVIIGRGSDCDIVLEDPGTSRKHLELRVTPTGTIASDLGSTNGIFVENHQTAAATLVDGNVITLGHTRITYREPNLVAEVPEVVQKPATFAPVNPVNNVSHSVAHNPTHNVAHNVSPTSPPDPFAEMDLSLPHDRGSFS